MSRPAKCPVVSFKGPMSCVLALVVPLVGAQTIADYSRAQSALLESTMSQAAARSAGLTAPVPAVAAASSVAASAPTPRMAMPAMAPAVLVSGVFASRSGAVAEVVVNATAYLLGAGQGIPGTAWHVETIAIDRVVLGRQGGAGATDAEGARRIFALPALH
jgi:type IV pilus biogenesis protein PilP